MSIEPVVEQAQPEEKSISQPFPQGTWGFLYGLFVLFMPILAFWSTDLFKPEWQDGKLSSYVVLFLSPKAAWFFFPFIAYSILSYLFLLGSPARYSQHTVIRFGIYTGVLLALHFSIVSALFFFNNSPVSLLLILLWVAPFIIPKAYGWMTWKWGRKNVLIGFSIVAAAGLIWSAIAASFYGPFILVLVILTTASPVWCFLLFLQAAIWLHKNAETNFTLPHGFGIAAWLGAYAVAWRISILKMYELYAALPPQPPPDCYIATAAAQGHPQFVGAHEIHRLDGRTVRVNGQLQRLKCAELALMAVNPVLHKTLRSIYDVVGKALARRITNSFVADFAYLMLKPSEWLAIAVLKYVIPEIDTISSLFYTKLT